MADLIVVTGPPGAGKSTVARVRSGLFDPSALVAGDEFFAFIYRGYIAPWTAAAHHQNEIVVEAAAAAAGRLATGGYTVVRPRRPAAPAVPVMRAAGSRRALAVEQDVGMLVVLVQVRVLLQRMGDSLAATLVNARASLTEPGVLRFDVICEAYPAHVMLTEVSRDDEAAAARKLTVHYAAWRDSVAEVMAVPREPARFAAVFPAGAKGWKSGSR